MKKILIFGAGSIGNHMSYACSKLNHKVFVTDISKNALLRMKNLVYPKRYGNWNKNISLINYEDVFSLKINFDLVILGTPPITHYNLFIKCKRKLSFKKILIEKPLSTYHDKKIYSLKKDLNKYLIFCGYNHSVNPSLSYFFKLLNKDKKIINKVEIKWKEGWSGILGAHPWMKSEFDSYLGNFMHGGGAIHEHSHGIHALICILKILNLSIPTKIKKILSFNSKKKIIYDKLAIFYFEISKIFFSYETDLITYPAEKSIKIITKNDNLFWVCNYKKNYDAVIFQKGDKKFMKMFKKSRSSEFENEIKHIFLINNKKKFEASNINLFNSLNTLKIISKVFDDR